MGRAPLPWLLLSESSQGGTGLEAVTGPCTLNAVGLLPPTRGDARGEPGPLPRPSVVSGEVAAAAAARGAVVDQGGVGRVRDAAACCCSLASRLLSHSFTSPVPYRRLSPPPPSAPTCSAPRTRHAYREASSTLHAQVRTLGPSPRSVPRTMTQTPPPPSCAMPRVCSARVKK